MLKLLFICAGNACRSQMAEGLINHDLKGEVQAFSAGVCVSRVYPRAIQVMAEIGINISGHALEIHALVVGDGLEKSF